MSLNSNIDMLNETIQTYNECVTTYNSNMTSIFNTFSNIITSLQMNIYRENRIRNSRARRTNSFRRNLYDTTYRNLNTTPTSTRTTTSTTNRGIWSTPIITTPYIYSTQLDLSNLQDVLVIPTSTQIENAVEIIQNDSSITQEMDPIDLIPFRENETIMRIRYCGHCFRETNLREWFRASVRCPLCRYDIRNYTNETETI